MSPRYNRLPRGALIALVALWVAVVLAALPARAAEPAQVTLKVQMGSDGVFRATAQVVDAKGAPASEVPVVFRVRTTFGWLSVGKGATDASGRTQVRLPATVRPGEITAEAGDDGQVRATVRFGEGKLAEPAVRPGRDVLSSLSPQPGFISPYPVPLQVALLGVILGGIWTTYGYMIWLLSRIRTGR